MVDPLEPPSWRRAILDPARLFLFAIAGAGLLLVAGLFFARPAYRALKRSRALTQVQLAEKALADGRIPDAFSPLRLALSFAPSEPSVLRLAARICTLAGNPEAVSYWQMYLAKAPANRDEQMEFVRAMHRIGRPDVSREYLDRLLAETPADRDLHLLSIERKASTHETRAAIEEARQLLGRNPEDPAIQYRLGVLLSGRPFKSSREQGRRLLWGLAIGQGPEQVNATLALARQAELSVAEIQVLEKQLAQIPSPDFHQELARIALRFRAHPEEREALLAEVDRLASNEITRDQADNLAGLYFRMGGLANILAMIPEAKARADSRLGQWRAEALASLERWSDLEALLRDPSFQLPGPFRSAALGVAASNRGADAEANSLFDKAIAACGSDTPCLARVATMAETGRQPAAALRALELAVREPEFLTEGATQMARVVRQIKDAQALLPLLKRLAELFPEMEQCRIDYAYTRLLLDSRDASAQETAIQLATQHPRDPTFAVALGLALVRNGQAEAALKLFDDASIDWKAGQPRWTAVRIAALGAAGHEELARKLAATLNTNQLMVQEYDLVRRWREVPVPTPGN